MFDPNRTTQLINGALFDARTTWKNYLEEAGDWQKTAILLTVPLIIVAALVSYVLGVIFGSGLFFGIRLLLLSIISGAVSVAIAGFVFSYFAGMFGGKRNFALGFAAATLAAVPGYVGQALSPIPWIGWLLSIALGIYALVQLWRIIPLYLEVPDDKRVVHYIVSLIACIVVSLVVSAIATRMLGITPANTFAQFSESGTSATTSSPGTGLFGGIAQRAELLSNAQEDRYEPPANGRLTERQVEEFIRVMERADEVASERGERLQALSERTNDGENMSLRDFGDLMQGINDVSGLSTAEVEIVKSGGGNWAEHQWVKEALYTAWLQETGNDTIDHNYALYQQYEDTLQLYITR